jgi:3' terminal RNA ribose 2'-O-methyltransferase Hen1
VLVPVLDGAKHYWVGDDEVEKLLRHGEGWLADAPRARPDRAALPEAPAGAWCGEAIARLVEHEEPDEEEAPRRSATPRRRWWSAPSRLNEQRLAAVLAALRASGRPRVVDLGCGEGKLLRMLLASRSSAEIVGMDVSPPLAGDRGRAAEAGPSPAERQRERIRLIHGSLMYRDARLAGFDAAAVVEVVEHLDPPRLAAFERVLFELARPGTVVLTTPNAEYNVRWDAARGPLPPPRPPLRVDARAAPRRGPARWPRAAATPCATSPWAPTTPRWARPRRWPCSRGATRRKMGRSTAPPDIPGGAAGST